MADSLATLRPPSPAAVGERPFAYREHAPPLVNRDFVINVVFLGAPCSGKTTITERLAQVYGTRWMPEYGREYWEAHQINRRLTSEQLIEIAEGHIEREDALFERSNRYLFTDTNAITTAAFARYYHGRIDPRLAALAERAVARYDLVFVCDIDIPYDNTWDRSGEVKRATFQRQVIADLNERTVPFLMLRGTLEERVAHVRRVLDRFRKYTRVRELSEGARP